MNRLRSSQALLLGATLLGLGLAIAALSLVLRHGLRRQVLEREAGVYHAITIWQRTLELERLGQLGLPADEKEFALLALEASRLPEVIAVEAFAVDGRPLASLGATPDQAPPVTADWETLRARQPIARLIAGDKLSYEVLVPVHEPGEGEVTSVMRYLVDAETLRREFAALDRQLLRQALTIWALAGAAVALALTLVFRRLRRAERALLARTADLEHANRELTFAAKTSALGALAAHLVHGLRNPVAGLAALPTSGPASPDDADQWREASAAAQRIRQMIDEVVTLLQDEGSSVRFEVTAREVLGRVSSDVAPLAQRRGVAVIIAPGADVPLDHRTAGLCGAILRNLARNACEALAASGRLTLATTQRDGEIVFTVEDDGPGLPPEIAAEVFAPAASTKPGGAGIGLAISRQLALHLGARLTHERPGPRGARFELAVPLSQRSPS